MRRVTRLYHENILVSHRRADANVNRLVGEATADTLRKRHTEAA